MVTRLKAVVTACAVACALVTAAPQGTMFAAAGQQDRAERDRDVQELRQYRLSMPKVKQMAAATIAFAKEAAKDPSVKASRDLDRQIEALEHKSMLSEPEQKHLEELRSKREALDQAGDDKEDEGPKTLADMARRIDKEPRLAAAIKGAGLTTREYSLVTLSFFQAMFAHMMQKSGTLKEMPKDIAPENVQFVEQNEAELTQIFAELQAQDK